MKKLLLTLLTNIALANSFIGFGAESQQCFTSQKPNPQVFSFMQQNTNIIQVESKGYYCRTSRCQTYNTLYLYIFAPQNENYEEPIFCPNQSFWHWNMFLQYGCQELNEYYFVHKAEIEYSTNLSTWTRIYGTENSIILPNFQNSLSNTRGYLRIKWYNAYAVSYSDYVKDNVKWGDAETDHTQGNTIANTASWLNYKYHTNPTCTLN